MALDAGSFGKIIDGGSSSSAAVADAPAADVSIPAAAPVIDTSATPPAPDKTVYTETIPGPGETKTGVVPGGEQGKENQPPVVPSIDPELESFMRGKGFDAQKIASDPVYTTMVKSQFESERAMNQMRSELDRYKSEQAANSAEVVATGDPEAIAAATGIDSAPVELGPVQTVQRDFQSVINSQCQLLGCRSIKELQESFPEVWANINNIYQDDLRAASVEEVRWEHRNIESKNKAAEEKRRLEGVLLDVKTTARTNIDNYRKEDPAFDQRFVRSGARDLLKTLSDGMGVPVEFLVADKRIAGFMSKASKAIDMMQSGEYRRMLESEIRADIKKQDENRLPQIGSEAENSPLFPMTMRSKSMM